MKKFLAVVAILCLASVLGFSQEGSKVQVFGGYQFTSFSTAGLTDRQLTHGWDGDVAVKVSNHFSIVGDVSGSYKSLGSIPFGTVVTPAYATRTNAAAAMVTPSETITFEPKLRYYTFATGPRFTFLTKGKLSPFAQFTVGIDHVALTESSLGGLSIGKNGFGMSAGGGLDINVNKHFSARLFKFDYKLQHLGFNSDLLSMNTSENLNHFRFATGVVYKF